MRTLSRATFALLAVVFSLSSQGLADPAPTLPSRNIQADTFQYFGQWADNLVARYGAKNVVVGYDIDNTLLQPLPDAQTREIQEVGSDEWFTWQASLLAAFPAEPKGLTIEEHNRFLQERAARARDLHATATDIVGLIDVYRQLLDIFHTQPVDPQAPAIVRHIQDSRVPSIVITARSENLRPATERELKASGYDFAQRPLVSAAGFDDFLPYDVAHLEGSGLKAEDIARLKLSPTPTPLSYRNGILMVSGQHKGAMLRSLLEKAGSHPKAVLFIDDTPVQVERMQDAFAGMKAADGTPVEVVTINFTKTWFRVLRYLQQDKSASVTTFDAQKAAGKIR